MKAELLYGSFERIHVFEYTERIFASKGEIFVCWKEAKEDQF